MKSYVKEKLAKFAMKNAVQHKIDSNGLDHITMSPFAQEMIYTVIPKDKVTVKNWILDGKMWQVTATMRGGRQFDVSGESINDCLFKILGKIDEK